MPTDTSWIRFPEMDPNEREHYLCTTPADTEIPPGSPIRPSKRPCSCRKGTALRLGSVKSEGEVVFYVPSAKPPLPSCALYGTGSRVLVFTRGHVEELVLLI